MFCSWSTFPLKVWRWTFRRQNSRWKTHGPGIRKPCASLVSLQLACKPAPPHWMAADDVALLLCWCAYGHTDQSSSSAEPKHTLSCTVGLLQLAANLLWQTERRSSINEPLPESKSTRVRNASAGMCRKCVMCCVNNYTFHPCIHKVLFATSIFPHHTESFTDIGCLRILMLEFNDAKSLDPLYWDTP